jgi:PAS domain S-box-containing protein
MPESIQVLHVDDPDFADLAADVLEAETARIQVTTESSVSDGLDRLENGRFDCIVSDYALGTTDGVDFLTTVREDHPDIPFLLFTGKGSEAVASEAIAAGATDYIPKESGTEQFELLANRIENAVEQYRTERRVAELERIREMVRDITQALIRASTREEVERRVCEIMAEARPYKFVAIAGVDDETKAVTPREWAGDDEGYVEDFEMRLTEDAPGVDAPAGRAYHDRETVVSQDIQRDPTVEPWHELALESGFRSLAVTPIEYDDELFGLFAVYTARRQAFDEEEMELLGELADDIAQALHLVETRQALREERDRRSALVENTSDAVLHVEVTDGAVEIKSVNGRFVDVFGYDPETAVGADLHDLIASGEPEDETVRLAEQAVAGETIEREVTRETADGMREFIGRFVPIANGADPTEGYAVYTDITERKEHECELEAARERLATVISNAPLIFFALDEEGVVTLSKGRGLPELGLEPGDAVGESVFDLYADYDDIVEDARRALDGERVEAVREVQGLTFESTYVPILDEDGTVTRVIGVAFDITERTERERELREINERLNAIIEASPAALVAIDMDAEVTLWNPAAERLFGWSESEMLGAPIETIVPEDLTAEYHDFRDTVLGGESVTNVETERLSETGDPVDVSFSAASIQDSDGETVGVMGAILDISDLKATERELERRNERLEEFTRIVSHDLRNPLNLAITRIELARDEYDSEHLDLALKGVERMETIIDDTLSLARQGETVGETEPVSLAGLADRTWATTTSDDATLDIADPPKIEADPERLRQVFENLYRNAIQHGAEDVTITVGECAGGFYVADDGPGIDEAAVADLFEPGYTTSEDGTGFGLPIVKEIVDAHGWTIAVTESSDGGARFEITDVEYV